MGWRKISLVVGLVLAAPAQGQQYLPVIGGPKGAGFDAPCPPNQNLAGFELRAGADIDAIKPICLTSFGPQDFDPPVLTSGNGLLSSGRVFDLPQLPPGWFGTTGGSLTKVICPADRPVVLGIQVEVEGRYAITLNKIALACGLAVANPEHPSFPTAQFEARREITLSNRSDAQSCPPGTVAIGAHGRSGNFVDAVGLICGPVRLDMSRSPRVRPSARVKGPAGQPASKAPLSTEQLCNSAELAAQRNSSAAPGLASQCAALKSRDAAVHQSYVEGLARDNARIIELAARGAQLEADDPYITQFREKHRYGGIRGVNVAVAAAQGHTEPGPGKDALRFVLQGVVDQRAYTSVVSYVLDRNRNPERARLGAKIVDSDAELLAARNVNGDIRYWVGFDIATAIFGDPAMGAQGNKVIGPGAMGIRNGLSAVGQNGFDAAAKLHLSRNYNTDPQPAPEADPAQP